MIQPVFHSSALHIKMTRKLKFPLHARTQSAKVALHNLISGDVNAVTDRSIKISLCCDITAAITSQPQTYHTCQ